MKPIAQRAQAYFESLQDTICAELERLDGSAFKEDRWSYDAAGGPPSGGGITRIMTGPVFEKAGVNTSGLHGVLSERLAERLEVEPCPFFATGISLVIHPVSPRVPTTHMNLRFLQMAPGTEKTDAWFGGGADLTPYYLEREDAAHFHRLHREACDAHDPEYYPRFKKWCDDYFHVKHRGERRGIGGIFFDYLKGDLEKIFEFIRSAGDAFLPAYVPIVERRQPEPWGPDEKQWQRIRRGRYVEFNLVYDRGTLFGLETRGRTESILMSLPPQVEWHYEHHPQPGSPEAELLGVLREPVDWV